MRAQLVGFWCMPLNEATLLCSKAKPFVLECAHLLGWFFMDTVQSV